MLVYDLTNRGKKSKYEYLYQCLKEDILSGKLAEGEKCPQNAGFLRQTASVFERL